MSVSFTLLIMHPRSKSLPANNQGLIKSTRRQRKSDPAYSKTLKASVAQLSVPDDSESSDNHHSSQLVKPKGRLSWPLKKVPEPPLSKDSAHDTNNKNLRTLTAMAASERSLVKKSPTAIAKQKVNRRSVTNTDLPVSSFVLDDLEREINAVKRKADRKCNRSSITAFQR